MPAPASPSTPPPPDETLVEALAGVRVGAPADATGGMPVLQARRMHTPYPLLNLLAQTSLLRHRLGEQGGVPLALTLRLLDPAAGWRPITRAAVYCWHGQGRAVQVSGLDGRVSFQTVYPERQADGIARLHLEVFATEAGQVVGIARADLELPAETSLAVHGHPPAAPPSAPSAPPTPAHPADPAGTPLRLQRLAGDAPQGFSGCLTLGLAL